MFGLGVVFLDIVFFKLRFRLNIFKTPYYDQNYEKSKLMLTSWTQNL